MNRVHTPYGPSYRSWSQTAVFLAGGISGCPDWQTPTADYILANTPEHVVVLNPRQPGLFDPTDRELATAQIAWEYSNLEDAEAVLFWFPKETLCPITLFELGKELVRAKARTDNSLFIGVEPGYARALDIEVQVSLMFPEFLIHDNLDTMARDLVSLYDFT